MSAHLEHPARFSLHGPEGVWRLGDDALEWIGSEGAVRRQALAEVREMRLLRWPHRSDLRYAACELRLAGGGRLRILATRRRAVVLTVPHIESYRRFVTALAAALARHSPECRFRSGPRQPGHAALWIGIIAAAAATGAILFRAAGADATDLKAVVAVTTGIGLLHMAVHHWINRPGGFDPHRIPERLWPG